MSFPLGVFHVHFPLENVCAIALSLKGEPSSSREILLKSDWQAVVTFPSRSASDVYWRRVQEAMYGPGSEIYVYQRGSTSREHAQCFRINGHWRTYHHVLEEERRTLRQVNQPASYESRIVLLPLAERQPDNINGGTFYIRSSIRQNLFWYYDPGLETIQISSQFQTKFTIRRKTPLPFECGPEDDILIGEDDINIFVTTPEWEGDDVPDIMIVKNPNNKLLIPASVLSLNSGGSDEEIARVVEAAVFKFSMFDRGFGVMDSRSWDGKQVFASDRVNGGERWEFVQ